MIWAALTVPEDANPYSSVHADAAQISATGGALCLLAALVLLLRRHAAVLLFVQAEERQGQATALGRHPYMTLFLVSLVVLFIEVMFIRYASSQIRIFAFYKNIPLVSCFLGLGLGCFLRRGAPRHVLWFLLWMVPLAAFLSQGALVVDNTISLWGATASSEFILGDNLVAEENTDRLSKLAIQISIGSFCSATLAAIAALFCLLGRLLGSAFEEVPRIPGYTTNILGSLAGIMLFVALSYLQTPPWIWYLAGMVPLLAWLSGPHRVASALALIALCALAVMPSRGETVWSPYQKLVGHTVDSGYWVQISDVFYQVALDLRPEAIAQLGYDPAPHYNSVYQGIERPDRVLVVGAGTGNDVAAALRAGASHVDAVDIDPAIVAMGRRHHPERPYDDPRVRVIVDDARSAFRTLPPHSYDAVVFGLLDSHTQLGMSSVRLDNYVFTGESFAAASRLLRPGGSMIVTAVDDGNRLGRRFSAMLAAICNTTVDFRAYGAAPKSFVCQVGGPSRAADPAKGSSGLDLPSDDWPFLYLPERGIPQAYLLVVAMLAMTSVWVLRRGGLELGSMTPYHGHMFFLGAAFLLMEVYAINRLALLFGTTWLVSAITIGAVLLLIVLANLTVSVVPRNLQKLAYPALVICLVISFWIDPASVLGKGTGLALGYALFILSPVYFAGLIFAHSFRLSATAGPAIGANILGAVLGGWVEYATMVTGIRVMALLALAFYLASLAALVVDQRRQKIAEPAGA
jgi:SAM-dependent methyltransferase